MMCKDTTLAIDLGPDAVRLIEVRTRKGRPVLDFFADQSLPEGTQATLPDRHLAALRDLLGTHRVRTRRAIAALPTSMVLTRTVQLDKAKGESTREQIEWTLQNCLPFDPRDLVFDFWTVSEAASRQNEVMVVATQGSVVQRYLRGFEQLKLECVHLDVAPCALATLISHTVEQSSLTVGAVALCQNLGFFAITERGRVLFWRPFELPNAQHLETGRQANLDRIGEEVSKCVSHMVGAMHLDALGEMQLFGYGADDLVVNEYLKNRFHVPVRCPSPFEALPLDTFSDAVRNTISPKLATHYCTAMGLAMQKTVGGVING